jgi:hypothetical protein
MIDNHHLIFGALLMCGILAGCAEVPDLYTARRDTVVAEGGESVAANRVTQMVDPWPRASSNRNIAFNGQKMQTAVERYRTNQVTPPVSATTSSASYGAQGASTTAATPGSKP